MSSSESLCPVTKKGVHALAAHTQRLELYPIDCIRVSGSPETSAPLAAIIPPVARARREPLGRKDGHQWGDPMAVLGEKPMAIDNGCLELSYLAKRRG
jgi:hypothetical protein